MHGHQSEFQFQQPKLQKRNLLNITGPSVTVAGVGERDLEHRIGSWLAAHLHDLFQFTQLQANTQKLLHIISEIING